MFCYSSSCMIPFFDFKNNALKAWIHPKTKLQINRLVSLYSFVINCASFPAILLITSMSQNLTVSRAAAKRCCQASASHPPDSDGYKTPSSRHTAAASTSNPQRRAKSSSPAFPFDSRLLTPRNTKTAQRSSARYACSESP